MLGGSRFGIGSAAADALARTPRACASMTAACRVTACSLAQGWPAAAVA